MKCTYNFSAGPAVLPKSVMLRAQSEMLDWHGSGMSVMEMSHRGKHYMSIIEKVERFSISFQCPQKLQGTFSSRRCDRSKLHGAFKSSQRKKSEIIS